MNPQLVKFIESLSKKDKKTLSQKTLKTVEEVGELAKQILPFENAYATQHKFSSKEKILEECCDAILCIRSICAELGYTQEDIEKMLWKKAEIWSGLQKRENLNPFPLPFEMHVTVSNVDKDKFIEACSKIGVKAITLDLQDSSGKTVLKDVQTSSKFVGTNRQAYEEVNRIARDLELLGFDVTRKKIEAVPWHPAAPSKVGGNSVMHKDGYFESHIEVIMENTDEAREKMEKICHKYKGHLSKNSRKKLDNNMEKLMVTVREYDGVYEDFVDKVEELYKVLSDKGYQVGEKIIEFTVYDTKISHDKSWISK